MTRLDAEPYAGPLFKPRREPKSRSRGLKSKAPLKASNSKRKAEKYARNFSGPVGGHPGHDDFVRSLPCAVRMEYRSDVQAAHVEPRGMEGAKGDWRGLVPLCRPLHKRQEGRLEEFEAEHQVNLRGLALALVVADPGVSPGEQLAAWRRLHEEFTEDEVRRVLQHGLDLCGSVIEPPKIAAEESLPSQAPEGAGG